MAAVTFSAKFTLLVLVCAGLVVGCSNGTVSAEAGSPEASVKHPDGRDWARSMRDNGFTKGDVEEAKRLLAHDDPLTRCKGLTGLRFAKEDAKPEALGLAEGCLKDSRPVVRQYALSAIASLDSSKGRKLAAEMKDDPDPLIREKCNKILQKS